MSDLPLQLLMLPLQLLSGGLKLASLCWRSTHNPMSLQPASQQPAVRAVQVRAHHVSKYRRRPGPTCVKIRAAAGPLFQIFPTPRAPVSKSLKKRSSPVSKSGLAGAISKPRAPVSNFETVSILFQISADIGAPTIPRPWRARPGPPRRWAIYGGREWPNDG